MTASERNLWRMAELAVKNNNVDEVFKDICVITARDFKSLKAKEQVKYLKLSYDKRKLVREMVK